MARTKQTCRIVTSKAAGHPPPDETEEESEDDELAPPPRNRPRRAEQAPPGPIQGVSRSRVPAAAPQPAPEDPFAEQRRLYQERYAREVRGNHYSDDNAFETYRELGRLCSGRENEGLPSIKWAEYQNYGCAAYDGVDPEDMEDFKMRPQHAALMFTYGSHLLDSLTLEEVDVGTEAAPRGRRGRGNRLDPDSIPWSDTLPRAAWPYALQREWRDEYKSCIARVCLRIALGLGPAPNCTGEEHAFRTLLTYTRDNGDDAVDRKVLAVIPGGIPAGRPDVLDGSDGKSPTWNEVEEFNLEDSDLDFLEEGENPDLVDALMGEDNFMGAVNLNPNSWFKPFKLDSRSNHMVGIPALVAGLKRRVQARR